MIEFKGNISEECKKYIWNRETKFVSLACIITALIFSGIVIIVALKVDLIILMFLLLTISFAFLGSFPQKGIDERLPQSISIENNEELIKIPVNKQTFEDLIVDKNIKYYIEYRTSKLSSKGILENLIDTNKYIDNQK